MRTYRSEIFDSALFYFEQIMGTSTIQILLELDPAPSRENLVKSLKRTMAQVPIMGCRLESGAYRDRWVEIEGLNPDELVEVVELESGSHEKDFYKDSLDAFDKRAGEMIDLSREAPVRLILFRRDGKGLLVIRLHHSLADGNGCLQLAGLLGNNINTKDDIPMPELIEMNRNFHQLWKSFGFSDIPGLLGELAKEALRPLIMLFMNPLIEKERAVEGRLKPSIERLVIQGEEFKTLQRTARDNGLTMNDILALALLGLAGEINSGLKKPSPFLGVAFTVNLRRFLKSSDIQIANISGISILTSKPEKALHFHTACDEVRKKIGELKRKYLGLGFVMVPSFSTYLMPAFIMRPFIKKYGGFVIMQTAGHMLGITNIGAMDSYLSSFGESLKNASVLAPIWKFPLPLLTVTGFRDSLTIHFAHLYKDEKYSGLTKHMADRLRYYLLEWAKESHVSRG